MKYEIVETQIPDEATYSSIVIIYREDGSIESFPVDESNPRYVQFLEETTK